MKIQRNLLRNTFATVLGVLMACGMANSQPGTGPFAAFPTQSVKDGRFLGFACAGLATMEQSVRVDLTAPPATTTFNIDVFDGDTGGADGSGNMHWDLGTRQLKLSLYADPLRTGNPVPVNLIGTWYGNAANATSGPLWSSSAATMPDNDWWALTVTTSAIAQAPSGNYFYALVIETDGACSPGEQSESSLKLATSNAVTFSIPNFGLVASLRQVFNDIPILYPGSTATAPATGSFLSAPTTYDGTFELFLPVAAGETELRLFDGDFDFGTDSLLGYPSGVSLDACADTDDPGTSASYDGFPFDTTGARAEGVQGAGVPPDDNNFDAFRRGELGDPNGIGCVRYELSDPEANTYFNDNPSGDLEWEQFMVASTSSPLIGDADWVYTGETVPAGIWKVKIVGLDLSNLNCWHTTACATTASRETLPDEDPDDVPRVAACPDDSVSLVGSFPWKDEYFGYYRAPHPMY